MVNGQDHMATLGQDQPRASRHPLHTLCVISQAIRARPDCKGGHWDQELTVGDMVKAHSCRAVWLPWATRGDPRKPWRLQQVPAGGNGPPGRAADWIKL